MNDEHPPNTVPTLGLGRRFLPQEHAQVAKIKVEFAQQLIEIQQQVAAAHAAAATPRARRTKSKATGFTMV